MTTFWTDRNVCVTGAGFLGMHLVTRLCHLGARVRVLTLPTPANHPLVEREGVDKILGDLLDPYVTRRAVAGCEVVFHTAGIVAVWGPGLRKMHAVHVEGTRRVLDAIDPGTRVVHTSSVVAVGAGHEPMVLDEDSPFRLERVPIDYVHAKRQSEQVALDAASAGKQVVVVNPAYLVGPDDWEPSVMGKFCAKFWRGSLTIAPPGGLNFVDVRDVVEGHLAAAERGRVGRRYILAGENRTFQAFMARLANAARFRPRAIPVVPRLLLSGLAELTELRSRWTGKEPYPGRQSALLNRMYWYYRSDRAREELGYQPRPLDETLRDTYAWFSGQGSLTWKGLKRWWLRPAA